MMQFWYILFETVAIQCNHPFFPDLDWLFTKKKKQHNLHFSLYATMYLKILAIYPN